jgi:repressor LexA
VKQMNKKELAILIGNRIKIALEYKGIKASELATKTGINKSKISCYINGRYAPGSDTGLLMANALGVAPAWLGGFDVPMLVSEEANSNITNIIPFETKKIPLLGDIACGEPIICNQEYDLYINVAANLNADFCVRAKGDSMINARIFDGDLVICKKQPTVENGEIAVVIIDNEATLKRFYKHENSIELRPENPLHKPINFSDVEQENVRILGKAVAFQSLVR